MHKPPVSLRERNRLETWALIHDEASKLACEQGLANTTVEAIADAAGVSKRTFFNYFPAKEDAILGIQGPTLSEETIACFRAGGAGDLFGRTVHLMVTVIRSMFPEASRTDRRRILKERHPELARNLVSHLRACEELVEAVLLERYPSGPQEESWSGLPPGRDSALALLMLAGTVMRFAFAKDPSATTNESSPAVQEAIEIFRDTIKAAL
ncbi:MULTISPECIES: TetR/AcrR family transcriptional regulator [Arthrobacter]|uniref:TetR/AcrR family transcriptional regulator n=1 Tax=unclassified Arthrobacter TaxID=235627 RepID=UPI0024BADECE|nr:TetR/AcrR family transcriptional regulator [Arthrobacter sp. H35-MC1]MDJ0317465.1 TetR family transcriptional regulator [Arthrobacter sp. H35-MC1]